jgi:hypothetical protein
LAATNDQRFVAAGAATDVLAMLLLTWLLYRLLPVPASVEAVADRIGYALRWNAFGALPLFAMIVSVGNGRLLGEAIDRPSVGQEATG